METAKRRGWLLAGLALVLVLVGLAVWRWPKKPRYQHAWVSLPPAELAQVKNAHAHGGAPACPKCHVERSEALLAGAEACGDCHRFHSGNHPVGVAPKQVDPALDLPLAGGKVACFTCHDPHDVKRNGKGLRARFDDLCFACHQDKKPKKT
jgi:predicted CXXCH cytochrome family protein